MLSGTSQPYDKCARSLLPGPTEETAPCELRLDHLSHGDEGKGGFLEVTQPDLPLP